MTRIQSLKWLLFLAGLSLPATVAADHPSTLSAAEIERNMSGTVVNSETEDGRKIVTRFAANGEITRTGLQPHGSSGKWSINNVGHLCISWKNRVQKCGAVQLEGRVLIVLGKINRVWTIVEGWRTRDKITIPVNRISADGTGESIGVLHFFQTPRGVRVTPALQGLTPGPHALHIHENPDCGPGLKDGIKVAGLAAGAHFHKGPQSASPSPTRQNNTRKPPESGFLGNICGPGGMTKSDGDFPEIWAGADGKAKMSVMNYSLSLSDLFGRSVLVHQYGETPMRDDQPPAGARIAGEIIPR